MKRMRWWQQLVLFVMMIAAIELYATNRILEQGYESLTSVAVRDPVTMWRLRANMRNVQHVVTPNVSTNAEGLRDEDIPTPKPPGEIRILCLGGSVTYGYGLRALDTFPRQLETTLQAQAPAGTRVRVINGGQPGYGSFNGAALLEEVADRYQPDVVIAMFANNDLGIANWRRYKQSFSPAILAMRRVLFKTATYRCLLFDTTRLPGFAPGCIDRNWGDAGFTVGHTDFWVETADNLRAMHEYLAPRGARLVIAVEALRYTPHAKDYVFSGIDPKAYNALKTALKEVGRDAKTPVLCIDEAFKKSTEAPDKLFLQGDCVHPSVKGATIIADTLAQEIWRQKWVGRSAATPSPASSPRPSPATTSAGPSPR